MKTPKFHVVINPFTRTAVIFVNLTYGITNREPSFDSVHEVNFTDLDEWNAITLNNGFVYDVHFYYVEGELASGKGDFDFSIYPMTEYNDGIAKGKPIEIERTTADTNNPCKKTLRFVW